MSLSVLREKIENKEARLAVIGLGYVGIPVACLFAEVGFNVTGVDIQPERVGKINKGVLPLKGSEPGLAGLLGRVVNAGRFRATTDYKLLRNSDVVLIAVETPVDENHIPQYEALKSVCRCLGPVLRRRALVIVESTVAPGTTEGLVLPLLEKMSGQEVGADFYLGVCPERVMPGKLLSNLRGLSRVCGGNTQETSEAMIGLYRHVVQADLDPADCLTAELVKTAENAYRDVNIAFANELALVCEASGGDFPRVRKLVNKSPGRNVLLAGGGVGGHCLPKDPWLLVCGVKDRCPVRLIPVARAINDGMPRHVAEMTGRALKHVGQEVSKARIAVLGYAYLEDSSDTRNNPSTGLVEHLQDMGASVLVHDPWVREYRGDMLERVTSCDAVVVMVAHSAYKEVDLAALKGKLRTPILIDARRVFDAVRAKAAGFDYYAVGLGNLV